MARSLSVKIPTASLIADIEATLAQIDAQIAEYPTAVKQYETDLKAHQSKVIEIVVDALKNKQELIGTDYDSVIRISHSYGRRVDITVNPDAIGIPESPEKPSNPNERQSFGRDYVTRKSLLEKNLKVLRMTNQEEVNASTYNTVMELL
jgi:hypothetical protein